MSNIKDRERVVEAFNCMWAYLGLKTTIRSKELGKVLHMHAYMYKKSLPIFQSGQRMHV